MKSIVETSFYLLLLTFICYINIDFVLMNQQVSRVNELEQYIEDYIEVHGSVYNGNQLDEKTWAAVEEKASDYGMKLTYAYAAATQTYTYFNIQLEYTMKAGLFKMAKTHTYRGLARVGQPVKAGGMP